MAEVSIKLQGIIRNQPDNIVPDGAMQELVNLRPWDGALRPVGKKTSVPSTPVDVRYIHVVNETTKVYIGVITGKVNYWVYVGGELVSTAATTVDAVMGMSFASLRNALLVSNHTSEITTTLLYDIDTGAYVDFSDNTPAIPTPLFQSVLDAQGNDSVDSTVFNGDTDDSWTGARTGEILKMITKQTGLTATRKDGYFTGKYLVRCAWELTDGTITRHTIPCLVDVSTIDQHFRTGTTLSGMWYVKYQTDFIAKLLQIKLSGTANDLLALKTKYKDLIRNLNIYVSRTKMPDTLPSCRGIIDHGATVELTQIDDTFNSPDIKDISYYLIAQIDFKNISIDWKTITPGSLEAMTSNQTMPTDNNTHHKIFGQRLFTYNDRIFLAKIKNILFPGFSTNELVASSGEAQNTYEVGIEYDILTSQGTKTVFGGWKECNTYTSSNFQYIQFQVGKSGSYWGYPDARAKKARFLIRSGATIYRINEIDLFQVPELNFSYYYGFLSICAHPLSYYPVTTLTTGKDTYWDYNRVQATELSNPFYYPAINSYRVGTGVILGLSTNAIALSQGQFGQFPLFCFTTEGIWAMNIGDGDVLISTIVPLSPEVCNNPESITITNKGVIFSTDKALYILSGANLNELSEPVEGKHTSWISGSPSYASIVDNPNRYQISDYLCSVPFLTYLSGARIAYDYKREEVIICNSTYKYSWVYSLKFNTWFKISEVFDRFVSVYPTVYGYLTEDSTYKQCNMSEEDYLELRPVHLETRPMKFGSRNFKKLHRMLLDGMINNNIDNPYSIYLFGSTDGSKWYLLNNGNTFTSRTQLVIGRSAFSCQMYILVCGGKVDGETYFTTINVEVEERWAQKIR